MLVMESPVSQTESPYEAARLMQNAVRKGTIEEVRLKSPARVRVRSGDNVTDWLPWFALRAGGADGGRKWNPPVIGEQCVVLSQGGDLAQGVAFIGLYSDDMPQGSEQAACDRTDWDEENFFEWLRGALTIYCTESVVLNVNDKCSIAINGERVSITAGSAELEITPSRITSNVDIVAQGVSLVNHLHTKVQPGFLLSGEPLGAGGLPGGVSLP